jgi:hypothetical protein
MKRGREREGEREGEGERERGRESVRERESERNMRSFFYPLCVQQFSIFFPIHILKKILKNLSLYKYNLIFSFSFCDVIISMQSCLIFRLRAILI